MRSPIALEPRRGVGVLPSKAFGELSASFLRFLTGGRVGDLREPSPRFGLHGFRELIQHVQDAVIPASLLGRVRPDLRQACPDIPR